SFDNAVCRQAHFGLSFKNHIVRGFKPEDDILSRRVNMRYTRGFFEKRQSQSPVQEPDSDY
ncbi:MAG: hypothetical protein ABW138_21735, partial [Candidatus Thiodiazotropha sp. 4PDIVS1]